jgi:hypothetical protein
MRPGPLAAGHSMIMILKLNPKFRSRNWLIVGRGRASHAAATFHYIEMAAPFKVYGCLKLTQGVQDF